MKKFLVFLCATLLIFSIVNSASAAPDQFSPYVNATFNADSSSLNWQQEVEVGIGGVLTSIDLYATVAGLIDFYINIGSPWQSDTNDFIQTNQNLNLGWTPIDVSSVSLMLGVGDTFVIGVQGINGGTVLGGSTDPSQYTRGQLFLNGASHDDGDWDIAFKTHMDPIPEPATMLLLGSGLIGLAGARRKLKK